MNKFISILIIFFVLLSQWFAYSPTSKDEVRLNNVYLKVDKFKPESFRKLYIQILMLKLKYKDRPQISYLLSELWEYIKNKIEQNKLYEVLSVIDWDTVKIEYNWKPTKLRLIWVDTPETYTTRYGYKECYGDEASTYLKQLLNWKYIWIEFDETQDREDKYGRLLVYIKLDGENINAKLIKEWYAFEYTYITAYKYQKEFKNNEKEAKDLSKWLWNVNTCNWERKSVSGEEKTPFVKYYYPNNLDYLDMWFNCDKPKYCKYMSSCDEVKYYYYICWAKWFDWDKDLIPCESICWVEIWK